MLAYDQKEVEVGGRDYVLQAMAAEYGLTVMDEMIEAEGKLSTKRMIDIIKRSVTFENKLFDEKSFNVHFSRKYEEIGRLFEEIMAFNFGMGGEETGPLELPESQVDTIEK